MKLVILLGPPGVGKGTQCSLLSSRLGYKHISTGTIIRNEIKSKSELGLRVQSLVESGNLVDDKTILSCLEKAIYELNCPSDTTILLDGLPRNLAQANQLDIIIKKTGFDSFKVVCLDADTDLLTQRFESRFTCSNCSAVESIINNKDLDLSSYKCKSCGTAGVVFRRRDDEASTVKHRLDLYEKETLPLVDFYKGKKNISFVNGLLPPELVYVRVASFLI